MFASLSTVLAQYGGDSGSSGGGGYGATYWIIVALIAIAVVAAAVWIISRLVHRGRTSTSSHGRFDDRHERVGS